MLIMTALTKIALAFALVAFTVAVGTGLAAGVGFTLLLYKAGIAAGIFALAGGFFSLILLLFFTER
jgi:hypothetical protein